MYFVNNHFTFYLSYLGMNYSNVIGYLIFIVFLLQFLSGCGLAFYHSPLIAFSSVYYIMIDVNVGWIIRFFHVLGSSLFMVPPLFHLIRGTWIRLKMIEQLVNFLCILSWAKSLLYFILFFICTLSVWLFLILFTQLIILFY